MSLKRVLKSLSFLLIAIGAFIVIIQPFSTTGAVIDLSAAISRIWFFVGLGIMAIGTILLINFGGEESKYLHKFRPLYKILQEEGRDADTAFVLDSSGVIDYKPEIKTLLEEMKGRIYAPREIIKELRKNPNNAGMLNSRFTKDYINQINPGILKQRGFYGELRKARTEAKRALERTEKHVIYRHMRDIINNNGERPKKMHEDDFKDYNKEIENLNSALVNKYGIEPNKENQLSVLKKHTRANAGDLAVLSNALLLAGRGGKKAKIFARDSHLREAVDNLISKYPTLNGSLKYIQYSETDEDEY